MIRTTEDLTNWQNRNGLRLVDAAAVLKVTTTSVKRIKSGNQALTTRTSSIAEDFEKARTEENADLAMAGELLDLADLCDSIPFSVVTGMTAAAMIGWTTASTHVRYIALPPHFAARHQKDKVFALPCALLPEEVRLVKDANGRTFRVATPERIVVDCVRFDVLQGQFHVEEVVRSAIDEGVSRKALRDLAGRYGADVLAALDRYLGLIK